MATLLLAVLPPAMDASHCGIETGGSRVGQYSVTYCGVI